MKKELNAITPAFGGTRHTSIRHATLYYTILSYVMIRYTTQGHDTLYYTTLYCTTLQYTTLHNIILYNIDYTILHYTTLHATVQCWDSKTATVTITLDFYRLHKHGRRGRGDEEGLAMERSDQTSISDISEYDLRDVRVCSLKKIIFFFPFPLTFLH